jgi:hypothetical protein
MITFVDFTPSDTTAFQFQAVLDGIQHNVVVTYNFFGQRYYVNVYDTQGALVIAAPMVGSPPGYDIDLMAGRFTSTMIYRTDSNRFEISDAAITYPDFGVVSDWILDSQNNIFILDGKSEMIA